jgi:hypothetical protein
VPSDHTLGQHPQLLVESIDSDTRQVINHLLYALTCSYVHLPSEQLNARLVPEEVRMGSARGGVVEGAVHRWERQEEEERGGGSG